VAVRGHAARALAADRPRAAAPAHAPAARGRWRGAARREPAQQRAQRRLGGRRRASPGLGALAPPWKHTATCLAASMHCEGHGAAREAHSDPLTLYPGAPVPKHDRANSFMDLHAVQCHMLKTQEEPQLVFLSHLRAG